MRQGAQRRIHLVRESGNTAPSDTTPELQVGNSLPVTPVTASMSGAARSATRVEPWNTMYPTPDFSGGGYFLCLSPVLEKEANQNGKRKPVHL